METGIVRAEALSRMERMLGAGVANSLYSCRVTVVGLGGVGGHAAEAVARCGVGTLRLIDCDRVEPSNLNRQLVATLDAVGREKAMALADRLRGVMPGVCLEPVVERLGPDNLALLAGSDYVIDAIDDLRAKVEIAQWCAQHGTPLVSCMGTGNRLDPTAFRVTDLFATEGDPVARIMRRELRKRGLDRLRVVWSPEIPRKCDSALPGSVAFVPPAAGMALAGCAIRYLTAKKGIGGIEDG